jgi:hypothetical protein
MAIQLKTSRELPLRANLLVEGFELCLRNWPCVVWSYAVNLGLSLLAGVPISAGLAYYLDHSLAAQRIAGTLDTTYLATLGIQLRESGFFPMVTHTTGWLNLLQLLVLFIFFAGSVFIFVSAEPPRLSVILRGGIAYFWRFVRSAILVGCISGIIVGILLGLRSALLHHADAFVVERQMFLYSAISGAVVLLVALLARLWWDLVEVYIVRNAMDGERRVHVALLPALRLLWRYFFRTAGSFLLAGLAGVIALALCLYLWLWSPAHQVWLAALLGQLGLFLLLASRFWQRGIEAALVMSADPPRVVREDWAEEMAGDEIPLIPEGVPTAAGADVLARLSEPTLSDLVAKLRTEPLANPDILSGGPRPLAPSDLSSFPPLPARPAEVNEPSASLFERHEGKYPLGGASPEKPDSAVPETADGAAITIEEEKTEVGKTEEEKVLGGAEKLSHSEEKPPS